MGQYDAVTGGTGANGETDRAKRWFLVGALAALTVAPASGAFAATLGPAERSLWLRRGRTGEVVREVYWADGQFVPDGLLAVNKLFRDSRSGEILPIDIRLMDLLATLHRACGSTAPIELVSGYRTPNTNRMLRNRRSSAARNSLHMEGMAADIRIPDRDMVKVRKLAIALKGGGVAYYRRSRHLHVDVGAVRYW